MSIISHVLLLEIEGSAFYDFPFLSYYIKFSKKTKSLQLKQNQHADKTHSNHVYIDTFLFRLVTTELLRIG